LGGTLDVTSGARVGGNGSVAALTVASGGTVAPGNSIGTLSVGNLNLAAGAIFEVEVDAAGNADRVNASGAVTIDGASMSVLAAQGDYAPLTSYTVLTSQGGITGSFANVTSDLAFLTPTLSYDAGRIVLNLTRNNISFVDVARTPNQRAVAGAVSTLSPANVLFNALVGQDAGGARAAFDQLSGEIHPSVRTVMAEDGRLPREAVLDRLAWAGEGSGGWGRAFGNWGKSDGNGNAADTRRKTGGLVMGLDASTPGGLRFGLAGGYTRTDVDVDARLSEAKVKSGHVLGYAGARFDALGIRLGLGYSWSDIETDRSIAIGSLNDRLVAAYDGELLQAFGEVAYDVLLGGGTLSPFAGVSVVDARTEGFGERGGPTALSVAKADQTVTYSTLGARAETAAIGPVSLRATGAWQRVWGGHTPTSLTMLSGATTPAVIGGVPLSRNSGIVEADVVARLGTAATLTAGYSGRLGGSAQDHAARATLTIAF
jgi:outer membrane autotransporter protein